MDRITKSFYESFINTNEFVKYEESDKFELFSNYCVVASEFGSSTFDIEEIMTGKATQGIDGIAIVVNNQIIQNVQQIKDLIKLNRILEVKFILIQAKSKSNFDNSEILNFFSWTNIFFSEETNIFTTDEMKNFIEMKEFIYSPENCILMSRKNPELVMYYVTVGNWANDNNLLLTINSQKEILEKTNLFSKIEFIAMGASDLQKFYRKSLEKSQASFSFEKKITMKTTENIKAAYYGVIPFKEFKKIIIDEKGNIKNVFEDNIRDFLGDDTDANKAMSITLKNREENMNFAILNNGITIVADEINTTGDNFSILNYQIVNGCQTSHILYENRFNSDIDNVNIPLRIISTDDEDIKNQITTATNNQTAIKKEQLEALTSFQRDLEKYYSTYQNDDFVLYYERRTNQYNKDPIAKNKIVTIPTQIKVFSSMFLENPHEVSGMYGTVVKKFGDQIFKPDHKLIMYYLSALAFYKIENYFKNGMLDKKYRRMKNHMLMLLKMYVFGDENPYKNSKKMETLCQKTLEIVKNQQNFLKLLEQFINLIKNDSTLDLSNRKLFEKKETTDILKKKLSEMKESSENI